MNQTDLRDLKANKVPPKTVNRAMTPADLAAQAAPADLDRADLVLAAREAAWAARVEWAVVPIDKP
jgi:hypothetical protein